MHLSSPPPPRTLAPNPVLSTRLWSIHPLALVPAPPASYSSWCDEPASVSPVRPPRGSLLLLPLPHPWGRLSGMHWRRVLDPEGPGPLLGSGGGVGPAGEGVSGSPPRCVVRLRLGGAAPASRGSDRIAGAHGLRRRPLARWEPVLPVRLQLRVLCGGGGPGRVTPRWRRPGT